MQRFEKSYIFILGLWALNFEKITKVLENDLQLRWCRTKHTVYLSQTLNAHTVANCNVSLHNHSDIINSSNSASLQQQWCLGAGGHLYAALPN